MSFIRNGYYNVHKIATTGFVDGFVFYYKSWDSNDMWILMRIKMYIILHADIVRSVGDLQLLPDYVIKYDQH